jgi:hypothetical protein
VNLIHFERGIPARARGYDGKDEANKKTIGFMSDVLAVLTAILLKYAANDIISFRGR